MTEIKFDNLHFKFFRQNCSQIQKTDKHQVDGCTNSVIAQGWNLLLPTTCAKPSRTRSKIERDSICRPEIGSFHKIASYEIFEFFSSRFAILLLSSYSCWLNNMVFSLFDR